MAPSVAKTAFTIALSVILMGLCALLWIDPESPEFVADILAMTIAGVFLVVLIWHVRRASRLPSTGASSRELDHPSPESDDQHQGRKD